jgi:hypothetical protein
MNGDEFHSLQVIWKGASGAEMWQRNADDPLVIEKKVSSPVYFTKMY